MYGVDFTQYFEIWKCKGTGVCTSQRATPY